jgi:hypothetical protein
MFCEIPSLRPQNQKNNRNNQKQNNAAKVKVKSGKNISFGTIGLQTQKGRFSKVTILPYLNQFLV